MAFKPLPGKVQDIPEKVVKDLSRDQVLAYTYAKAIQTGIMPDDLVSKTIGPLVTSRWNTTGTRVMCKFTRTRRLSKWLVRLTMVVINIYQPGWFKFKCSPHIKSGAKNFFFLVELPRSAVISE